MENIQPSDQDQAQVTQLTFGQDEGTQDQEVGQVEGTDYGTWDSDKRYDTHWGEDPNKMYHSLRYHEKKQGDFDNQIKDYKGQVESLKEYQDNWEALQSLASHPTVGPKFSQLINEYQGISNESQTQEQVVNNGVYDPNQQFNQHLQPIQQKLQDIESWKNDLMNQVNQYNTQEAQDQQFQAIDEVASKHGLKYDKNSFVNEMQAKGIPVEYWSAHFSSVAMPQVLANVSAQSSESALRNANATQSMAGAGDKAAPSGEGLNFTDKLMAASFVPIP